MDKITLKQQFDEILNANHKLAVENEELQEENEILKENAIHNDKVVDKVNWENRLLKDTIDKAIEHLHKRNEQNNSALTNKEETIISKHELLKLEIINNNILEDILRGEDNELIKRNNSNIER